jgi:hypothetical protein
MLVKALKDFYYRANPGNKLVLAKKGDEVNIAGCEYLSLSKKESCSLVGENEHKVKKSVVQPMRKRAPAKPKKEDK